MKRLLLLGSLFFIFGCSHHKHCKHHGGHKGHKARWKQMDTNGDGKLSKSEYMAGKAASFKQMDANGDGFVTHEEKRKWRHRKWASKEGRAFHCAECKKGKKCEKCQSHGHH